MNTETSTPALCIVIVSFNTRDMTLECIASVKAETQTSHEIIVVDNASNDGSADAIRRCHPDVLLLAEEKNHGFGPAHAIALEHARASWVLLLNPDTVVLDNAIDRLLVFAEEHPEAGIWGGRTLNADQSLNPASCFAKMTLWSTVCRVLGLNAVFRRSGFFNSEYFGAWPRDSVRKVDIVSGCFLLIRKDFWHELSGFDPIFTMYGEDVDLCLRAQCLGASPMVTPDAQIVHYGGASERVRADKLVRLMRAKIELIKRHFPKRQRRAGIVIFGLWPLSRCIAYGIGAKLTGSESLRIASTQWREVWSRRCEWQYGFTGVRGSGGIGV